MSTQTVQKDRLLWGNKKNGEREKTNTESRSGMTKYNNQITVHEAVLQTFDYTLQYNIRVLTFI